MKSMILVCALLVLFYQGCQVEAENCNDVKGDLSLHYGICGRVKCHPDGSVSANGCGDYVCKKQIGYKETDPSKPYPDCCGGPICAEDK